LIPGNDDAMVNDDLLNKQKGLFLNLDGKRISLPCGFDLVGYSHVPITPFDIKDRERFDMIKPPTKEQKEYFDNERQGMREGIVSVMRELPIWMVHRMEDTSRGSTIESELKRKVYTENPGKTVYIIHAPPLNTCLDMKMDDSHIGSLAVRQFIEKCQPYLTLHGHIHQTVDSSGKFMQKIGKSMCLSSGNSPFDSYLAVLPFDINKPGKAERLFLRAR
ncbi:MAG: hypothetical protein WCK90_05265, partial [archaeon]